MFRLKSDLYRNFAIGFLIGAGIVAAQIGPEGLGGLVTDAQAAPATELAQ